MVQNLHTHCTCCDGKNTIEEMIQSAVNKGLHSIGFSSHAPLPMKNTYAMTLENFPKYIKEVNEMKEKYAPIIDIYLGIETELFSEIDTRELDYVICAVHGVLDSRDGGTTGIHPNTIHHVASRYQGDYYGYIKDYFACIVKASKRGDILAHFDLVAKHNANNALFDETSNAYLDLANEAILQCIENKIIFEVNTGGIQRGYRKECYPATQFLDLLRENHGKIIITSDAHDIHCIDFYFQEATEMLKSYGFKNQMILTKNGFDEIAL